LGFVADGEDKFFGRKLLSDFSLGRRPAFLPY